MSSPEREATRALAGLSSGDRNAAERLFPLIYDELRRIAARRLRGERVEPTLQTTALVHEAYVRLVDASSIDDKARSHFVAIAARVMRQVLVEHARRDRAQKRGGGLERVTLLEGIALAPEDQVDAVVLDDALTRLAERSERQARVVELRFFGGLGVEEVAAVLGVSPRTVKGDWRAARAWLRSELGEDER